MGRAIAEKFAAEGADVGMCARSGETLQAAADSVRAHGVRVVATPADVADAEQIKSAIDRTVSELGRLDALVVNAGGPPRGVFAELDEDKWEAAHFAEDDIRAKVKAAKKQYENALREKFFGF